MSPELQPRCAAMAQKHHLGRLSLKCEDISVQWPGSKDQWLKHIRLVQNFQIYAVSAPDEEGSSHSDQDPEDNIKYSLRFSNWSEARWFFRWAADPPLHLATGLKNLVPRLFSAEGLILLSDEYEPSFPNDYEKAMKHQREEQQIQWELERQKEIEEREKKCKDRHEASRFSRRPEPDSDEGNDQERSKMGGAAIAPSTSLIEKDKELPWDFPMKRIQNLAYSLPKMLFLPLCTRNKTNPDPQSALATPSLPTWGKGSI